MTFAQRSLIRVISLSSTLQSWRVSPAASRHFSTWVELKERGEGAVFEVGGVWELPFGSSGEGHTDESSSGVEKFHLGFELGSEAELDYEIIQLRL